MSDFACPHCTKLIPDAVPKSKLDGMVPLSRLDEKAAPLAAKISELEAALKTGEGHSAEVAGLRKQLDGMGMAVALARAGISDPDAVDDIAMRFERLTLDAEGKRPSAEEYTTARVKEATEGKGSRWLTGYLPAKAEPAKVDATKPVAGQPATRAAAGATSRTETSAPATQIRLTQEQHEAASRPLMQERQRLVTRNDAASLARRAEIDAKLNEIDTAASFPA